MYIYIYNYVYLFNFIFKNEELICMWSAFLDLNRAPHVVRVSVSLNESQI